MAESIKGMGKQVATVIVAAIVGIGTSYIFDRIGVSNDMKIAKARLDVLERDAERMSVAQTTHLAMMTSFQSRIMEDIGYIRGRVEAQELREKRALAGLENGIPMNIRHCVQSAKEVLYVVGEMRGDT